MKLFKYLTLYCKYILRNFKLDTIDFKLTTIIDYSETKWGIPWNYTDIIINGKSLILDLAEYERIEAKRTRTSNKMCGNYIGIDPQFLIKMFKKGSKTNVGILQCKTCQSSLCALNLVCDVKLNLFTIELYNFHQKITPQPFNNDLLHEETIQKHKWNYEPIGPFKFNKLAFFRKLNKLTKPL